MTRRHREIHKYTDCVLNIYQEPKVLLLCACPSHACALENKLGVTNERISQIQLVSFEQEKWERIFQGHDLS